MIKLSHTELKWILNMVKEDRDNSGALMDVPGQVYAGLHKLEYENMSSLAAKIETALSNGSKRIAVC